MPRHVVVDGSNLATEGRSMPSLQQLNDAVTAFMAENPTDLITVVVDATFGHRIDSKEVPDFEAAIEHNELVAPPAGAVGRGDAFVLSIAGKVGATILTNDSYQEFHPDYPWLFDEGRLIGGKPVPNIGWVFVSRTPVRGPVSRRATREKRVKAGTPARARASKAASQPMPVPKSPPPGAVAPSKSAESTSRRGRGAAASPDRATAPSRSKAAATPPNPRASQGDHVNELLAFLGFVEKHPVGSSVKAVVENYSSHGAYVRIGDVRGYVPLRLMADPPPRSAREAMAVGDSVTLVVVSFAPARRSIDLAVPELAMGLVTMPTTAASKKATAKKTTTKKAAPKKAAPKKAASNKDVPNKDVPKKDVPKKAAAKKAATKKPATEKAATKKVAPKKIAPPTKAAPKKAAAPKTAAPTTAVPKAAAKKTTAKTTAARARTAKRTSSAKAAVPAKTATTKTATTKTATTKTATTKTATTKTGSTTASARKATTRATATRPSKG